MYNLVDIGSHTLEVYTKGDGQAIVLLPGLGSSIEEWKNIVDELSNYGRVIAIHRAGLGKSTVGSEKRSAKETADDLKLLLEILQVKQPVILIGHSYGGFCAQYFSCEHASFVKSMVLVESSSLEFELLDEVLPQSKQSINMFKALSTLDSGSIIDKMNLESLTEEMKLPEKEKKRLVEFKSNPVMYKAMAEELEEMHKDASHLKECAGLTHLPLIVIGREAEYSVEMMIKQGMVKDTAEMVEEEWQRLIKNQLKISQNSKYILAEGSYHNVNESNPEDIIKSVLSLI